ncbi:hypothetical protein AB0K52_25555 [Glycomyces sp. NPDC049804]|uniref:hypothetical protein n=1 Tax=Glycomyces sp. NPDC049804 TaxID=3154363 RepID=UPI00344AF4CB
MDLIAGRSPCFKPPWRAWRIAPLGAVPGASGGGTLRLRVGYSAGLGMKPLGPRMEAMQARRAAGDPVASLDDLKASLVPVVVVDGRPAAAGWGAIDLPLAEGRHLVEVQSLHSRTWRAVDIAAGKTTRLDYVGVLGEAHRAYATGDLRGVLAGNTGHTLGPRGRLNYFQYLPALSRHRRSVIVAILAMLLCPLVLVAGINLGVLTEHGPVGQAVGFAFLFGIPAAALACWGLRVAWTFLRYNRLRPEAPLPTRPFAPDGALAPVVLDPDGEPPALGHGGAGLLIEARFVKEDLSSEDLARQLDPGQKRIDHRQRKALDRLGELVPIRHRSPVPPPEVILDGTPVGASWTRMWLEVPPGRHLVQALTPASPLPVSTAAGPPETGRTDIEIGPGQVVRVELLVAVTAVPDPREPVLHGWSCRIVEFGPAAAPVRPQAPKADLRGGLRRMWTNRYWDEPVR